MPAHLQRYSPLALLSVPVACLLGIAAAAEIPHAATALAYMPHGMCYLWNPALLAVHIGSDAGIATAYLTISACLIYFVRRRVVPFGWIVWMFGAFITSCALTHILDIWTIWHPVYWLSGSVKALTAAVSLGTAAALAPLIPRAVQYKSPSQTTDENARMLRFAARASETLAASTSLKSTLDALCDIVVPELAECVLISLAEADGALRTYAARLPAGSEELAQQLLSIDYARRDRQVASRTAMRTGETQVLTGIDDAYVQGAVDPQYVSLFQRLRPRSAVVVPMRSGERVFGTISIVRTNGNYRAFDEAEVALCETLASRAVVAIVNARHWEELTHAAYHDALTGLANRSVLTERLDLALAEEPPANGVMTAVLFIDIDRFKLINDSLGHAMGDRLLSAIARRLETCVRSKDTLARVSGDEFAVLVPEIESEQNAIHMAQRIIAALSRPFQLGEHDVSATASIGVALDAGAYRSSEEMMRDADIAMYRAKLLGKERFSVFEPIMGDEVRERLRLETELRQALAKNEFELHYQPIVSLRTGATESFEALVRWRNVTRGLVPPTEFIPAAEDTGIIIELGKWVLREACTRMKQWQAAYAVYRDVGVNVNVSPRQMRDADFLQIVRDVIAETGIEARHLHLEITETMLMQDQAWAVQLLHDLRALGVRIDLDDFGTGYSSLAYLHTFPIDTLKIDRSFVSQGEECVGCPEIVRTILALAENLNMAVVAEGVETATQHRVLRELGCAKAQGYRYSRPMDAQHLMAYFSSAAVG